MTHTHTHTHTLSLSLSHLIATALGKNAGLANHSPALRLKKTKVTAAVDRPATEYTAVMSLCSAVADSHASSNLPKLKRLGPLKT